MSVVDYFARPGAKPGVVYLVGSGPGDLGLLTMRAANLIATADAVVFDRLASTQARGYCKPGAAMIYVGKRPDAHTMRQPDINQCLIDLAREGKSVVRFKGGDPFVFGRGSEEALACKAAGVPFEIVPGISSSISVPAYAGIPITHRGISRGFAVFTGHEDPTLGGVDYTHLGRFDGTIVLLMAVGQIRAIAQQLIAGGKEPSTPVAMVRWGTLPIQTQLRATLGTIADEVERTGFTPPAVTVIGPVVDIGDELTWFATKPLHDTTIVVPRTRQDASMLASRLEELGANVLVTPTIAIAPPSNPAPLREAVANIGRYGAVLFTSRNAVRAFFTTLYEPAPGLAMPEGSEHAAAPAAQESAAPIAHNLAAPRPGRDARALAHLVIGALGPGTTAELANHGIIPDLVPPVATAKGMAAHIVANPIPGPVLLPLGDIASPVLADALSQAGIPVERVEAYQTQSVTGINPDVAQALASGEVDMICCTSSSTIRNLVSLVGGRVHKDIHIVSIGPQTSATCRSLGLHVAGEATEHTIPGLIDTVLSLIPTSPEEPDVS